MSFVDVVV